MTEYQRWMENKQHELEAKIDGEPDLESRMVLLGKINQLIECQKEFILFRRKSK